jgi:hypothetical protein
VRSYNIQEAMVSVSIWSSVTRRMEEVAHEGFRILY